MRFGGIGKASSGIVYVRVGGYPLCKSTEVMSSYIYRRSTTALTVDAKTGVPGASMHIFDPSNQTEPFRSLLLSK